MKLSGAELLLSLTIAVIGLIGNLKLFLNHNTSVNNDINI